MDEEHGEQTARARPGGCNVTQDDAAAPSPPSPPPPAAAEKSLLAFPSGADVN